MAFDRDFNTSIFVSNKEIFKPKFLSTYSFRQMHRTLVEFHDFELQQEICRLANKKTTGDNISFGYCCVDDQLGLQFHIMVALNRDGSSDYLVLAPEGKEIVLSYCEAKDKLVSFSYCYPEVSPVERCRHIMEQHEHNPTIMCKDLDSFRDIEFPLDIRISVPNNDGIIEKVRFRPLVKKAYNMFDGILLSEPKNSDLHNGDLVTVKIIYNDKKRAVDVIQYIPACWTPINQGKNLGEIGPNDGIIFEDEEYNNFCRITLEDCYYCFAVTCVVNEDMKHTVFCKSKDAYNLYEEIKKELQFFFDTYDPAGFYELSDFWDDFVSYY